MKLLPSKELNSKLQDQRASEAKAGLFLAKKVDALREELQEFQKTNDETIANLSKEMELFVTEQTAKKGSIIKEISELEEKRRLLQIPLDTEWEKVNHLKEFCIKKEESLIERESKNLQKENETTQKTLELSKREEEIKDSEHRTNRLLSTSELIKQEAEDILGKAKEYETENKKVIEIRTEAIQKRETDITYREIDADNKWENALSKEESNRKEILRIESKQRQLKIALDLSKNVIIRNTDTSK